MIAYREVTAVAKREFEYPQRYVVLPRLTIAPFRSPEYERWVEENWWMVDYSVHMDDKKKAVALSYELERAFTENPDHPEIPRILDRLRKLRSNNFARRTALEHWSHSAYQLVEYCGYPQERETITKRLDRYSGEVLEAMCGHSTYFEESACRTVTALDFCAASLERYPVPSRRRIECNLNRIRGRNSMAFFETASFDTVSICFGFRYPRYIRALVGEFRRILKPSGILSFIENPAHGYENLCRRMFVPEEAREILCTAGYSSVQITGLRIRRKGSRPHDRFYHVEARV